MKLTDEEVMQSYPPTKEQFLNAWRDIETLGTVIDIIKKWRNTVNPSEHCILIEINNTVFSKTTLTMDCESK